MIRQYTGNGVIIYIHGFANTFDSAIRSVATTIHRGDIGHLKLLPMVFSWPSAGNVIDYFRDTRAAEDSERAFKELLALVRSVINGGEIDIFAHSHGNKLLVRALAGIGDKQCIRQLILVEPDIGQEFMSLQIGELAKLCENIAIYCSENDIALKFSEFIYGSTRAGQVGLGESEKSPELENRLEVIDASLVTRGLLKHAPHESPEVLSDIYHLLLGMRPNQPPIQQ